MFTSIYNIRSDSNMNRCKHVKVIKYLNTEYDFLVETGIYYCHLHSYLQIKKYPKLTGAFIFIVSSFNLKKQ